MEQVTLVVNFDLPVDLSGQADNDTYLHRIGRAGRFGKRGFAVTLVDSQRSMDIIRQIELHFGESGTPSPPCRNAALEGFNLFLSSSQTGKLRNWT